MNLIEGFSDLAAYVQCACDSMRRCSCVLMVRLMVVAGLVVARASAFVDRVSASVEIADSGGLGRHRDPSELVASHAGDPADFS